MYIMHLHGVRSSNSLSPNCGCDIPHCYYSTMAPLFYETSGQWAVSAENDEGAWSVKIEKSKQPDLSVSAVSRDEVAIANHPVYVIDSVKAGKGQKNTIDGVYSRVIQPVFEKVLQVKHHYIATTSADSITKFAESLQLDEPVTVAILGGDTSVSEFVNGLAGNPSKGNVNLVVLPTGTGNALALSLGLNDLHKALEKLFTATSPKPLYLYLAALPKDTKILFRGEEVADAPAKFYFLVVFSWAFHASLVADSDTEELRQHGNERFKIAAQNNIGRPQKYDGSVLIGSSKTEGPFAYLVITPAQSFEPGFKILPKGDIHEQSLYVLSVGYEYEEILTGKYLYDIMIEAYDNGRHVENPKTTYKKAERGDTITIHGQNLLPQENRRFCVDGAIILLPKQAESSVEVKSEGNEVNGWSLNVFA